MEDSPFATIASFPFEERNLISETKLDELTDVHMSLGTCLKVEVIPHTAFHTETDIMERLLATCSIRRVIKKRSLGYTLIIMVEMIIVV